MDEMDDLKHRTESLHALRVTLRANQYILDVLKRDMRTYGLNENEFTVLELLYHRGPQSIQNIGKRILIASSSLTYVIDRLEAKKLVERTNSANDKRIIIASMTEAGTKKMEASFKTHETLIENIYSVLTTEELEQLIALTKKVGFKAQQISRDMRQ